MKTVQRIPLRIARIAAMMLMVFMASFSWAADQGLDINVDVDKGGNWYMHPVAWIVGGAVFILLLVALLKGNKSSS